MVPTVPMFFRFVLLSILTGAILHLISILYDEGSISRIFNFDPGGIFLTAKHLIRATWDSGFDGVRWLFEWLLRYFLLGAAVVVPIWLILRLVRSPKG